VPTKKALVFPYDKANGKYLPIPPSRWRKEFSNAWKYLNEVKEVLQSRERGRMAEREDWYSYIYPKNFDALSKPKLAVPDMCEHIQVCIDADGAYVFSGGAAGGNAIIPHDPRQMYFLAGLLNSSLIERILHQTGTKFRGGYLNCEIRFIKDLPVKLPVTKAEVAAAAQIERAVHQIVKAKPRLLTDELSDRERQSVERDVENLERIIDHHVLDLYGIDSLPD
jgi:hypothetical protein